MSSRPSLAVLLSIALALASLQHGFASDWVAWNEPAPGAASAPQRLIRDGQGGLYAYFQPVDIAGGEYAGNLSRLREDTGAIDPGFRFEVPHGGVGAVAVMPDGRVYVAYQLADFAAVVRVFPNGQVDPTFRSPRWARSIRFITLQPDGKLLVAVTDAIQANPPADALPADVAIYRLLTGGALDPAFQPPVFTGSGAILFCPPLVLANGGILAGGTFSAVNGVARLNVARLHANGQVDMAWLGLNSVSPVASAMVRRLQEQADGSVVVAGDIRYSLGGALPPANQALGAVRFTPAGVLDPGYGQPRIAADLGIVVGVRPRHLVPRADGGAVLVSDRLVAIDANGAVDPTFVAASFGGESFWVERGSDGRYYVPDIREVAGAPVAGMAAFAADGTPAGTFGPGGFGGSSFPTRPVRLANGDLLVAGVFGRIGQEVAPAAVRLTAAGEPSVEPVPDLRGLLSGGATLDVASIAPTTGGFYALVGGPGASGYEAVLARFTATGERDLAFSSSASGTALAGFGRLAPARDGVYLVGSASAQAVVSQVQRTVQHVSSVGILDEAFALDSRLASQFGRLTRLPDGTLERIEVGTLSPLASDAEGRMLLLLVGIDGSTQLVRILESGALDETFRSPSFGRTPASRSFPIVFDPVAGGNRQPLDGAYFYSASLVTSAAILPDGSVAVAGRFRTVGGFPRPGLALLSSAGELRLDFPRGAGPQVQLLPNLPPAVLALAADARGRLILGGRFDTYDGVSVPGLVRLRPDGTVDPADQPGVAVPLGGGNQVGLLVDGEAVIAAGRIRPLAASGLRPAAMLAAPPVSGPAFLAEPRSVAVGVGETATLEAVVSAAVTPTYQWYRGSRGDRSAPVAGGQAAVLAVTPQVAGTEPYWLEVSVGGVVLTSATAYVTGSAGVSGFLTGAGLASDTELDSDPDGDGVSVLEAYAFGVPGEGSVSAPALVAIPETGEQVVMLGFPRRREAVDIRYIIESSTDLVNWAPVGDVIIVDTGGDNDAAASQAAVPLSASLTGAYLRVRAEFQPGG